jgi:hypothetical protein
MKAALLCAACVGLALPAWSAPAEKRVYKIDGIITALKGGILTVQVKGAVSSGGWTAPHLRLAHGAPPHTLVLDFIAAPPPPGTAVIEGLVPIAAHGAFRLKPGVIAVEAQADANTITTQILH